MHLKSLEISGFKSFAKKERLEFRSSITSIVGPNGSGKSNVAEAFRFVLGEQSIKSLRGKKGEDMIFNGSNKVAKLNRAAVKLVFDNTKRVLNIDFDEVSLERIVHRDSSNEYFINGSQVRLRDIIELLASAHIGSTGHHIISQGEADKVLNANIRERRAMIEDALGLKIYQYKRQESERKLEKTEENIKSVESLRREIAPHLKFLRKQVEKVEKARELKESLKSLYREYFKREDIYLKHNRKFLDIEKQAPLAELSRLDDELKEAKEKLSSSNNQTKSESRQSMELISLEEKIKSERLQKDNLHRDLGRLEGEISGIERALRRIEQAETVDENKTVSLKEVQSLEKNVHTLLAEAEGQSETLGIKAVIKKIRDLFTSFISQHKSQNRNTEKDAYLKEIFTLQAEKKEIEMKITAIKEREFSLNEQYLNIKKHIEKEKEGSLEAEKAILKIMARQNEINARFGTLNALEEKLNLETVEFKRELGEAGILIGREAADYESFLVKAEDGSAISVESIATQSRNHQLERKRNIEKIKIRLEESGIGSSEEIIKEYKESEERDVFLAKEIEDLKKSAESLLALIAELKEKIDFEFREGIHKINGQFQEFFALMFGGGTAKLEIVREEKRKKKSDFDVLSMDGEEVPDMVADVERKEDGEDEEVPEGIDIHISLPHKKIKGLVMLSGGERALTSIALLFAMSQVNPPPFIILDETDAALDEANSRKYGNMIENLSKYSQLILITHNRETMSRAGVLYGVTMGSDGVSKLLSIEFEEAVRVAK
jgi:chromosome segregation protein